MQFKDNWFDASYYESHKHAGLDYLVFGDWQIRHAKTIKDICVGMSWSCLEYKDQAMRLLDLGCACGSIAEGLRQVFNCHVAGIDPSEHMIMLGRKAFKKLDLYVGSGTDMRMFRDGTFGLIHSMQVFEHLLPHCVPSVFLEMRRVLKVGGLAIVYLDYPNDPGAKDDLTHTCLREPDWWCDKANGFSVSGHRPLIFRREN